METKMLKISNPHEFADYFVKKIEKAKENEITIISKASDSKEIDYTLKLQLYKVEGFTDDDIFFMIDDIETTDKPTFYKLLNIDAEYSIIPIKIAKDVIKDFADYMVKEKMMTFDYLFVV